MAFQAVYARMAEGFRVFTAFLRENAAYVTEQRKKSMERVERCERHETSGRIWAVVEASVGLRMATTSFVYDAPGVPPVQTTDRAMLDTHSIAT